MIAFADYVGSVGRIQDLKVGFQILQGKKGAGRIGLQVQRRGYIFTRGPSHAVTRLVLDIQHCPDGITVCGTAIGTDGYVVNTLSALATSVIGQNAKLIKLPLTTQSQFILLRSFLFLRMVHFQRSLPWDQVAPRTRQVDQTILEAMSTILCLSSAIAPDGAQLASSTVLQQMVLPVRHGRMGLRMTFSIEAGAALLSGAAIAEAALYGGMDTCLHFNGARQLPWLEVWQRAFDDCAEVCGRATDTRYLPVIFVDETFSQVQHHVSCVVADGAKVCFLAAFDTSTN